MPPAGPPWRAAQEDWAGARQRVAADPAWAKWVEAERATVEKWMTRHQDRVEWVAGWSHDGISPKDGSHLRWTEEVPGVETDHFASPSDPRVEFTPKLMAWWVVSFRDRHVEMMQRAARLYRLTGDERYAGWVAAQMDFYTDNYLKWAPAREGARLFWQTLTEATNLIKFTEAVRQLGDYAAPAPPRPVARQVFLSRSRCSTPISRACTISPLGSAARRRRWRCCLGDDAMWREAIARRIRPAPADGGGYHERLPLVGAIAPLQ